MSTKKINDFPSLPVSKNLDSGKKVISELQRVAPSQIITLYEVDVEELLIDQLVPYDVVNKSDAVFRFHNSLKLTQQDIIWKGERYSAMPVRVEGYEFTTKGSAPSPKMTLGANEDELSEFRTFKLACRKLGDLIGAKVTRIKTFAKYLDEANFYLNFGGSNRTIIGDTSEVPEGFEPDPNAEFPREVFFIERKSGETGTLLEFELASFVDFENKNLPNRLIITRSCQFKYRGEGCLYEYSSNYSSANDATLREKAEAAFGKDSLKSLNLPTKAPLIADNQSTLIKDAVPQYNSQITPLKYDTNKRYTKGDAVYIEKNSIKYYFVCKLDAPSAVADAHAAPPNRNYWIQDSCSKDVKGCQLRWSDAYKDKQGINTAGEYSVGKATRSAYHALGDGKTHGGCLPFGGFPAVKKIEDKGN